MHSEMRDRIADYVEAPANSNIVLGVMLVHIVQSLEGQEGRQRVSDSLESSLEDFEKFERQNSNSGFAHDLVQVTAIVTCPQGLYHQLC